MVSEYTFLGEVAHSLQILFPGLCIHRPHISFCCIHLQLLDLSFTLISGTGGKLGQPVSFNLTAGGKIMGPLLHETQQGAYYILFGIGKGINQQHEVLNLVLKKTQQPPCVFRLQQLQLIYSHFDV